MLETTSLNRALPCASAAPHSLSNLTGHRWEQATGHWSALHRQLDPRAGRWTQKDPLGRIDGLNLYLYALNRPLSGVDLLGLKYFGRASSLVPPRFADLKSLGYPQFGEFYDARNKPDCKKPRWDIEGYVTQPPGSVTGFKPGDYAATAPLNEDPPVVKTWLIVNMEREGFTTNMVAAVLAHETTHAAFDADEGTGFGVEARILLLLLSKRSQSDQNSPAGRKERKRVNELVNEFNDNSAFMDAYLGLDSVVAKIKAAE